MRRWRFSTVLLARGSRPCRCLALGKGVVLGETRRHLSALAAYDKALALHPEYAGAWLGRGNVLDMIRHYDEALAAYDKALELKPDLAKAWFGRGNMYSEFRRWDDAFAAYDRAIELKPGFAEVWFGRGRTFSRLNRGRRVHCGPRAGPGAEAGLPRSVARPRHFVSGNEPRGRCACEPRPRLGDQARLRGRHHLPDFRARVCARRRHRRAAGSAAALVAGSGRQDTRRNPPPHRTNSRDPDRRIRSATCPPISALIRPRCASGRCWRNHDKTRFEVTCYSTSNRTDDYTDDSAPPQTDGATSRKCPTNLQPGRGRSNRYPGRSVRPYGGEAARYVRRQAGADSGHRRGDRYGPADNRLYVSYPVTCPTRSFLFSPRK